MAGTPPLSPSARVDGAIDSAVEVESVTKGSALSNGTARALWIGTAGTLNFTTAQDTVITNFPAKEGLLPAVVKSVQAGGTATDIWALY